MVIIIFIKSYFKIKLNFFFTIYSLEKNESKRATLYTLSRHDFIKNNVISNDDYEFVKNIVTELKK